MNKTIAETLSIQDGKRTWTRLFSTELGWIAFLATPRGVAALSFGQETPDDALAALAERVPTDNPNSPRSLVEQPSVKKAFPKNGEEEQTDFSKPSPAGIPGESIPDESLAVDRETPWWVDHAVNILQQYAAGEPVNLNEVPLDLAGATPFEKRVREQLARIGYGQTISYGELAMQSGSPGAARAVGSVMARNPVPLLIACHRVLGAGGKLGGYSAPSGLEMKKRLLKMENPKRF